MRYLKITLSGAILFLVYLWITVLLNSCNSNKSAPEQVGDNVEMLDEEMEGVDFTDSEIEGEGDPDFDSNHPEESNETTSSINEEDDDYVAGDYTASKEKTSLTPREKKPVATTTQSNETEKVFRANQPSTKSNSNNGSSSAQGDYMVIAGSYLLEENARKMINKLKQMGYSNAEIVYFNQSQYHSICAGRYNSSSSASQTAQSLKSSGIDSYVHRKQD